MRLLFITQKVDKDDPVLGVYHGWIEALAKKAERISVICLYRGRVELPSNVQVYSLGKESGEGRLKYLLNFYKYLWRLRDAYDRVLVHMNSEYMILAGFWWKISGKKPILWYNHPMGNWKARVAIALADRVLHTSPFAFSARYKKARQMPVGIDTGVFRKIPGINPESRSILYLGRLSPIKYVDTLIDAAFLLDARGVDFALTVAGEPGKESELVYADSLKKRAEPLIKKDKVIFKGAVPNHQASELYNSHAIYVNMTPAGSFDKTIIEAMASESLVVASNKVITDALPAILLFREKDANDLARALDVALKFSDEERQKIGIRLREYVVGRHDLKTLVNRLVEVLK